MTAYPIITTCARCGRLETAHDVHRKTGKRLGTDDGVCPGWEPGETRELVPEGVLRAKLLDAERQLGTLILAIEPLMDRDVVSPFITGWSIGGLDGPDGEELYEALRTAWENARAAMYGPTGARGETS